ncbi:hypothetical protein [Clostridium sp. CF012]|nr:hypothetical protein [Clostridium sp. CF012]MBU3146954.1 hypothetical protein [Clostridium sp. CF012]
MKNKELIEIWMNMDLEKEVRMVKTCIAIVINKDYIKETEGRIEISCC